MIKFFLILCGLITFYSCRDSASSGVIKQTKMQQVLWDMLRADALSQQIKKNDSSKSAAVESAVLAKKIFLIHHITEQEFQKSYSYYTNHPDIMMLMLDSINAQQSRIAIVEVPLVKKKSLADTATKRLH